MEWIIAAVELLHAEATSLVEETFCWKKIGSAKNTAKVRDIEILERIEDWNQSMLYFQCRKGIFPFLCGYKKDESFATSWQAFVCL